MIKKNCIVLIVALALMLCSCGKDNEKIPDSTKPEVPVTPAPSQTSTVKTIEKLDASEYGFWVFFSFEEGKIVEKSQNEEPKEGLGWDLAFNREYIKLNGPEGFRGQAVIADTGIEDFDAVTKETKVNFLHNKLQDIHWKALQMEIFEDAEKYICPLHSFEFLTENMPDLEKVYQVNRNVMIVRSAKGDKLYKMQFESAYNSQGQPMHKGAKLTFRYSEL